MFWGLDCVDLGLFSRDMDCDSKITTLVCKTISLSAVGPGITALRFP